MIGSGFEPISFYFNIKERDFRDVRDDNPSANKEIQLSFKQLIFRFKTKFYKEEERDFSPSDKFLRFSVVCPNWFTDKFKSNFFKDLKYLNSSVIHFKFSGLLPKLFQFKSKEKQVI